MKSYRYLIAVCPVILESFGRCHAIDLDVGHDGSRTRAVLGWIYLESVEDLLERKPFIEELFLGCWFELQLVVEMEIVLLFVCMEAAQVAYFTRELHFIPTDIDLYIRMYMERFDTLGRAIADDDAFCSFLLVVFADAIVDEVPHGYQNDSSKYFFQE